MVIGALLSCDDHRNEQVRAAAPISNPVRQTARPTWVVDPAAPGPDRPQVGRSLFDVVIARYGGRVPFPFAKLVEEIANLTDRPPQRVLIPLNRSLQRRAAGDAPFEYPRAILAVDSEPSRGSGASGIYLKDRLFIAYQEKAGILEVIGYNEAAGRFEFQVVRDYRQGENPKPVYANRVLCTTCHQNQAPIFARPLWRETNANPEIAAWLQATGRPFYGFPIAQGVDVPNAVDDATDRANRFSAYQRLWQEGCEAKRTGIAEDAGNVSDAARCRGDLFLSALEYRGGRLRPDTLIAPPEVAARWQKKWPTGLAIPSPDIPDRDPLRDARKESRVDFSVGRADVRAPFEPSLAREAGEVWLVQSDADGILRRLVIGLAAFFSEDDIRALRGVDTPTLQAAVTRMADPSRRGDSDALSAKPFRRAALMRALAAELSLAPMAFCCGEVGGAPEAQIETHDAQPENDADPVLRLFRRYCADCHHGPDTFPPRFLHGAPDQVKANIKQCAERILFRLSMWDDLPHARLEAPMPPFYALQRQGLSPDQWIGHDDFVTLRAHVRRTLESETGDAPEMGALIQRGYDRLMECKNA